MSLPYNGGKNGGETFGRFVKLFGKTAFCVAAIAEAFKIANGFLPVRVEDPDPEPTRLLVPEDLSLSLIIFEFKALFPASFPPEPPLRVLDADELLLDAV